MLIPRPLQTQVDRVYLVTVIVTDVKRQIACLTTFPTPKHCGPGTVGSTAGLRDGNHTNILGFLGAAALGCGQEGFLLRG